MGLSRAALGAKLNITRQYIFRVELGMRSPSRTVMIRWADELNATLDIFRDADLAA